MQFAVIVEGREVIAAGSLVLAAQDRQVTFDLSGMKFDVQLLPGPTPLEVRFVRDNIKRLVIELRGAFPEFTAAWKLNGIGQAEDRQIDLDLMIYSQSSEPDCVRQLNFTFTAHPGSGQVRAMPEQVRFT